MTKARAGPGLTDSHRAVNWRRVLVLAIADRSSVPAGQSRVIARLPG
jgi:hypothetical protein